MAHTPGPWYAKRIGRSTFWTVTLDPEDDHGDIANLLRKLGSVDNEADARLIAAAPDLLEALRPFAESPYKGTTQQDVDRARAAIAKARGMTHE